MPNMDLMMSSEPRLRSDSFGSWLVPGAHCGVRAGLLGQLHEFISHIHDLELCGIEDVNPTSPSNLGSDDAKSASAPTAPFC